MDIKILFHFGILVLITSYWLTYLILFYKKVESYRKLF